MEQHARAIPGGMERYSHATPGAADRRRPELYLVTSGRRTRPLDRAAVAAELSLGGAELIVDSVGRAVRIGDGPWRSLRGEALVLRLLESLLDAGRRGKTRAALYVRAWGEGCPEPHLAERFHFAMTRLRKFLGESASAPRWIHRHGTRYSLARDGGVRWARPIHRGPERRRSVASSPPSVAVREWLASLGVVASGDYQRRFGVSRATATRALDRLTRDGALTRIGAGRGCHYAVRSTPER